MIHTLSIVKDAISYFALFDACCSVLLVRSYDHCVLTFHIHWDVNLCCYTALLFSLHTSLIFICLCAIILLQVLIGGGLCIIGCACSLVAKVQD